MQTKGLKGFIKKLRKYRSYLLMLLPAVIYTLVFSYYPMTGVILAFKNIHMPVEFGEVLGMVLKILNSFLNPGRRESSLEIPFYIIYCLLWSEQLSKLRWRYS